MALNDNVVQVKIVGVDQSSAAINKALSNLSAFEKKTKSVGLTIGTLLKSYVAFGALNKSLDAAKAIADFSIKVEQAEAGFTTLLGSATLAEERIRSLTKFAADTPFGMEGVVEVNKMLQSLTDGALATERGMRLVGDAAAATGRPLEEVGMWVGRLYAGLESGTPVGEATLRLVEMGLVSGRTKRELDALVTQGALPANDAMAKLDEVFGFATGAMELQAQTLGGLITKIKDYALIAISNSEGVASFFTGLRDTLKDINLILEYGAAAEKKRVESMKSAHLSALAEMQIAWGQGKMSELELQAATIALNNELGRGTVESIKATAASFLDLHSKMQTVTQGFKEQDQVLAENQELWQSTYDLSKKMGDAMLTPQERQHEQVIANTVALTEQAEKLFQLGAIGSKAYDELTRKAFEYYQTQTNELFKAPAFESGGMGQFAEEDAFIANIESSLERARELEEEYKQFELDNILTMREAEAVAHGERIAEIEALAIAETEKNSLLFQEAQMHSARMLQIEQNEAAKKKAMQNASVSAYASSLGMMASVALTAFGKQSAAYKAFAIGEAITSTYLAANKALASAPPPASYALMAATIAVGLANVAQIASQKGQAHSGATSIPNEGTYLLNRGERVLAPEQNRDLTDALERGSIGGGTQIMIDGEVLAQTINQMASDGRLTIPARAVA